VIAVVRVRATSCVLALLVATAVRAQSPVPAPGAPLDASTFTYARAIAEGSGLTSLRLDAAALAHSRLDDIRLVDSRGRQVPYVLQRLDSAVVLALPALEPSTPHASLDTRQVHDAAKRTWYQLRLPHSGFPDASLRLSTSTRVFTREVGVIIHERRPDAASDAGIDRVESAFWTHTDPATPAAPLDIPLGSRLRTDSLFVLVNDGDNQKLPLEKPALVLPSYRLRFFREAGNPVRLLYGRADVAAPVYDVALIAPRLLDATAEEVTAAPERAAASRFGRTSQLVFWAALGAVVLLLLILIARLVRRADP
jgi:hypothetical protein